VGTSPAAFEAEPDVEIEYDGTLQAVERAR
jgi:hypothetical protein